jgi:hypothetical protein
VQAAGQCAGPDGVAQAGDEALGGAIAAKVDAGQDLQLRRLAVPAPAEVLDLLHAADLRQAGGQAVDGGRIRGGERAAVAGDDDGDRCLVHALERGGQPGGLQARAAGRQGARVVLPGDAGQRRQEQVGEHGRRQPGHDDRPAEADCRPPGGGEEPVHAPLNLLLSYLQDKELLLVVDNCEHLLGAVGQVVTDVLRAAPDVRVIATSREPLSVAGEHVVPVPPLELPPPPAAEPLARLRQNEAVMLFTDRAAAASGTFELTAANEAAVADLCRRLDGLPLAIELAAVRTRVLMVEQVLDRLTDRFGLLTGGSRAALPRHQTLRTTIEWSHDLLADGERGPEAVMRVRGQVHPGRRRVRLHIRERAGGTDTGPAVVPCR